MNLWEPLRACSMPAMASPWFELGGGFWLRRYFRGFWLCLFANEIGNGLLRDVGLHDHFGVGGGNHQTAQNRLRIFIWNGCGCLLQQTRKQTLSDFRGAGIVGI